jgi:hypothetical protein
MEIESQHRIVGGSGRPRNRVRMMLEDFAKDCFGQDGREEKFSGIEQGAHL